MKLKLLVTVILIVFSIGSFVSITVINNKNLPDADLVLINDVIKTAEKNWGDINDRTFSNRNLNQSFSVIDNSGNIIYHTPGNHYTDLYHSIKNRDIILDIQVNNEMTGKVIFANDEKKSFEQMKMELITFVCSIFGILMILVLLYTVYIYKTLLKPFKQLQHFAANIARGNFDIPLNINRNNYFGAFTESFDLLREELTAARQREYESNQSKKELVAALSHDIKTPVASIKAVSELMLVQAEDERVTKHVNTIYSKADQIDLLVTDMFHATLEELQQLKLNISEVSSEVLYDMFENVNYDQQIVYEPFPECIIFTDPVRMQQVIDNIISNSYKYAGTKIHITSHIQQSYLELHIMDFGKGISEEELPLLFNKYYRGKNVEGQNGSGLGLYISKYFMENMGGHISCHNGENGFTVILKIKLA